MLKVVIGSVKYTPSLAAFSFHKKDLVLLADMIRDRDDILLTNEQEVMLRVDHDGEETEIEVTLG